MNIEKLLVTAVEHALESVLFQTIDEAALQAFQEQLDMRLHDTVTMGYIRSYVIYNANLENRDEPLVEMRVTVDGEEWKSYSFFVDNFVSLEKEIGERPPSVSVIEN